MKSKESRSDARRVAAEAFYGALSDHPNPARRVGWESRASHALRLHAIADALEPLASIDTVIDVGCGEGALLGVLRERGYRGRYRGEDVLAAPIARARADHGADDAASFLVADGFAIGDPRALAVVCSGTLNTLSGTEDHDEEVALALGAMWERAGELLVVDLAVRDRHPDGVGLGRADLTRAWSEARALTPVVVVREDVIAGEALLILSRSRARAFERRLDDALLRGEALLECGDPTAALAAVAGLADSARALSLRGRARGAQGAFDAALTLLKGAVEAAAAPALAEVRTSAELAMAPCLWRQGDKRGAQALLERLAEESDEARAHLFELLVATRQIARARAVLDRIEDAWMRRELEPRLRGRAGPAG